MTWQVRAPIRWGMQVGGVTWLTEVLCPSHGWQFLAIHTYMPGPVTTKPHGCGSCITDPCADCQAKAAEAGKPSRE